MPIENKPGLFLGAFSSPQEGLFGSINNLNFFRYKRQKERVPLVDFMSKILPLIRERLSTLIENQTSSSCLLQKQILKIFYSFVQVLLFLIVILKCVSISSFHWILKFFQCLNFLNGLNFLLTLFLNQLLLNVKLFQSMSVKVQFGGNVKNGQWK